MNVYPNIKALRKERGMTQQEVAKYLNCSQVSYSYYEIGKRDIPSDILIKLASLYVTSTDYILGLTTVHTPYPNT